MLLPLCTGIHPPWLYRTHVPTVYWLHGRRSGRRGVEVTGAGGRVAMEPENAPGWSIRDFRTSRDATVAPS